jgi:cell division protein FtsA
MKVTASAIEFGTSKILTLIGEGNGTNPAELLGSGIVAYDGFLDGQWNSPDEVVNDCIRRSIQEAQSASQRQIEEIFVGVPGEFIKVEVNEVALTLSEAGRRVTVEDVDHILADAMEYKAATGKVIHHNPAWFQVDDKRTMEPVGMKGQTLRCMATFIVADENFIKDVTTRLAAMNVRVKGFASASLGEALMLIPPEERDKQAVLVDIGYLSSEVMVVEGDALIFHGVLPVGGGHIAADLAYGLECPMMVAEQVKRKFALGPTPPLRIDVNDPDGNPIHYDGDFVRAIVEPRIDEIAEMIQESLSQVGLVLSPRNTYYLTGGGLAIMRGSREYISTQLERQVKSPLPLAAKLNSPMYSSGLGLLELVYESLAQESEEEEQVGAMKKAGAFLKAFFTK